MPAETIISILFRIINAGVFFALGVYYFRRSLLGTLKQTKLDEQEAAQALLVQEIDLHQHFRDLDRQIKEQDKQCHHFQARVHQWHDILQEHAAVRLQEKQKIREQLLERNRIQQSALQQSYIARTIAPDILTQVHAEILKTFENKTHAEHYLDAIAARLNKERV